MIFRRLLTESAKTEHFISIFEHGVDTYHVVKYFVQKNPGVIRDGNLVKLAALVHDVGKLKKDFQTKGERKLWIHPRHTREFLILLLQERSFRRVLSDNGLNIPSEMGPLIAMCEKHHAPDAPLLRDHPEAILLTVADAIASMMEAGITGNVEDLLRAYPYSRVTLAEVKAFGFTEGLDTEIHRLDLPGTFVEDVFLASMIYQALRGLLLERGVYPILQRKSSLWVAGSEQATLDIVNTFRVNPQTLYQANFDAEIYSTILDNVLKTTGAGGLQADQLRFLLINEELAKRLARQIVLRDSGRVILEKAGVSTDRVEEFFMKRAPKVVDKVRFAGEKGLSYLVAGPTAAYYYHRWRLPPPDTLVLKVRTEEINKWYAYLRNKQVYVSDKLPGRKDISIYNYKVILNPGLTDPQFDRRIVSNGLYHISAEDLISEFLAGGGPDQIAEAAAIIYKQHSVLNWDLILELSEQRQAQEQLLNILSSLDDATAQVLSRSLPQRIFDKARKVRPLPTLSATCRKIIDDLGG